MSGPRKRCALLALLLCLLPSLAAAQVPAFNLPPGTVVGRDIGIAGPAQAIPFSKLLSNLLTPPFSIASINTNSIVFKGSASGTATVSAQAAAGTPLIKWPTGSGTVPTAATGPIVLDPVTGIISCPSCVATGAVSSITCGTGLTGGTITATGTCAADPLYLRGYLSGLTLSAAGATATFGIAAGTAVADTATGLMLLPSSYTKTTGAWSVGSGAGALDNSTIAPSTWYHIFLMKRLDTGVVDICISANSICQTGGAIPAAYTLFRRIGSMKTDGASQWIKFTQNGDEFVWASHVLDLNVAMVTSRTNFTLTVPPAFVVRARLRVNANSGAGGAVIVSSLLENDVAPANNGPNDLVFGTTLAASASLERITNTSAQISYRGSTAGGNISVYTYGWNDTRGR